MKNAVSKYFVCVCVGYTKQRGWFHTAEIALMPPQITSPWRACAKGLKLATTFAKI